MSRKLRQREDYFADGVARMARNGNRRRFNYRHWIWNDRLWRKMFVWKVKKGGTLRSCAEKSRRLAAGKAVFRTWRDVRIESAMSTKQTSADSQFWFHAPITPPRCARSSRGRTLRCGSAWGAGC